MAPLSCDMDTCGLQSIKCYIPIYVLGTCSMTDGTYTSSRYNFDDRPIDIIWWAATRSMLFDTCDCKIVFKYVLSCTRKTFTNKNSLRLGEMLADGPRLVLIAKKAEFLGFNVDIYNMYVFNYKRLFCGNNEKRNFTAVVSMWELSYAVYIILLFWVRPRVTV